MAEGRMLKKAISTSRKLANLKTNGARLLYTWLLPHLDIEGRFSGNAEIIKGYIFPRIKNITSQNVQEYLTELSNSELIIHYSVDGDDFLQFTKFAAHQRLNPDREAKSQIPPPIFKRKTLKKEEYKYAWEQWEKAGMICPVCKKKGEFITGKGIVVDGYIPFHIDHFIPISKGGDNYKCNLRVICRSCNLIKGNNITPELLQSSPELVETTPAKVKLREVKLREDNSVHFNQFWKTYPRKEAKKDAQKAFRKLNPSPALLVKIMDNLAMRKQCDDWTKDNGRFIPLPATYLRGERWKDQLDDVYEDIEGGFTL